MIDLDGDIPSILIINLITEYRYADADLCRELRMSTNVLAERGAGGGEEGEGEEGEGEGGGCGCRGDGRH